MATVTDRDMAKRPSQMHTPTAMGVLISGACNTGQKVDIPKYTTLNEKFDILANEAIGLKKGKDFNLAYYGIGIKGSRTVEGTNGLEKKVVYDHTAIDFAPFFAIPFLMRKLAEDIDETKRAKYFLRAIEIHDGIKYACYYAKPITFELYDPKMNIGYRNPQTGNMDSDVYIPKDNSNLNPVPGRLLSTGSIPVSDQYCTSVGMMNLSLENEDLDELKNVCRIILGDASYAAINEIYIIHGTETVHNGEGVGGKTSVRYTELCPAVTSYLINEAHPRDANTNDRLPIYFLYGNSAPMLVQPNFPTTTS